MRRLCVKVQSKFTHGFVHDRRPRSVSEASSYVFTFLSQSVKSDDLADTKKQKRLWSCVSSKKYHCTITIQSLYKPRFNIFYSFTFCVNTYEGLKKVSESV